MKVWSDNPQKLSDIKKGTFIRRSTNLYSKVYIKGDCIRENGHTRYSCLDTEDMNHEILIKGDAMVFAGFTY